MSSSRKILDDMQGVLGGQTPILSQVFDVPTEIEGGVVLKGLISIDAKILIDYCNGLDLNFTAYPPYIHVYRQSVRRKRKRVSTETPAKRHCTVNARLSPDDALEDWLSKQVRSNQRTTDVVREVFGAINAKEAAARAVFKTISGRPILGISVTSIMGTYIGDLIRVPGVESVRINFNPDPKRPEHITVLLENK